jgi:pyrimidine operon attenuation protein/uracil phosphoribosyltransferase
MHRNLPIEANYIGKEIDSITTEKVKVEWKETEGKDKVWIINE